MLASRAPSTKTRGPARFAHSWAERSLSASNALDDALDDVDSPASKVPDLGVDPLTEVPEDVSTARVEQRRAQVQRLIASARKQERALRDERASTLLAEIDSLNRGRLALLSYLSSDKQAAITGFTSAGLDQASSEARQLLLILRYHRHIADVWLRDLRSRRGIAGLSSWGVAAVAVPWFAALVVFVWLRRRSPAWLRLAELRLAESDRREQRTTPSLLRRALRLLLGFHRTLEWLSLYVMTLWLLPAAAQGLLELQLLEVVIGWTLGGALLVNVINALASVTETPGAHKPNVVGPLRLRSLRLVGRVIVSFILVLLVSARLVGEGTVYRWVWSTCWLAAIPVFLLLVRWWRDIVFERVERVSNRRPTIQKIQTSARFLLYILTFGVALSLSIRLDPTALTVIGGALAFAVGFALRDLVASFIAGITIMFDRPFQVGDRVSYGGEYGDIIQIGLRSVRMNTLDHNIITIPNNKVFTDVTSSANYGALEMQVGMDFYIGMAKTRTLRPS
jgi:hypothetical protein